MSKITSFNMDELWGVMDKHCSMMVEVEQRCTELAKAFGKINNRHLIQNVDFSHDAWREIVIATFRNLEDESTLTVSFNTDWLFDDEDYQKKLEEIQAKKKQTEEEVEYQEYLRLKKKFEGEC